MEPARAAISHSFKHLQQGNVNTMERKKQTQKLDGVLLLSSFSLLRSSCCLWPNRKAIEELRVCAPEHQ